MLAAPVLAASVLAWIGGRAGLITALVALLAATTLAKQIWRRNATPEEIRRDLENRLRNPP